jgi:hypothetical protein
MFLLSKIAMPLGTEVPLSDPVILTLGQVFSAHVRPRSGFRKRVHAECCLLVLSAKCRLLSADC